MLIHSTCILSLLPLVKLQKSVAYLTENILRAVQFAIKGLNLLKTDGADVDTYRQRAVRTCLEKRHQSPAKTNLQRSQTDPYHLQMAQTVVYRQVMHFIHPVTP